ncbi:MAG TPA: type VI secretion system-associated protein TagF, partial [Phenylobacterium sp.]|nr:type VI secretion system-associated protein TagF [Phenylobacterium sp.]
MVLPLPGDAVTGRRIWLFGKLPSHGDFVARGLDTGTRAAWDAWLSEGVGGARAALGEAFDAAYEIAPPWRFVLAPGPLG